ncbi:ac106 [Hemileuca sp. nucleopolyhedrovirus]|uniref:Ac106 n=1 Tax=Hemileuca sp. nucleopolyhedrovirus TaxID=1367203 RepID=S5N9C8_9ABAC|nr:ac106 [Hemileuca sp. nucleopolyhedrovirus]AGR56852.1 ac106 [Hemileuca sp. nucleopolyhedrovirus]
MDSPINVDVFARQLIADKCSALIESQGMLPDDILVIVKRARDEYFKNPTNKNYDYIKRLFSQTKYVDDAIDYKDFNRRMLLIVFKFALNKSKLYFKNYKTIIEVALKRLDSINPDLKSSPRAMLQHYNECLENLDNPRNDEHHLVTFTKEIATKIFIETIDLYSYNNNNKSPFEQMPSITTTCSTLPVSTNLLNSTIKTNNKITRDRTKLKRRRSSSSKPNPRVVTPLFTM